MPSTQTESMPTETPSATAHPDRPVDSAAHDDPWWITAAVAALSERVGRDAARWRHDPVWLAPYEAAGGPDGSTVVPLWRWAVDAMDQATTDDGASFEIVPAHLALLARAAWSELVRLDTGSEAIGPAGPPRITSGELLHATLARFAHALDLSADARRVLDHELEHLLARRPRGGRWLRCDGPAALEHLYRHALAHHRAGVRRAFYSTLDAVVRPLADRLIADRALDPTADAPDALRAGLGGAAGVRIDVGRLAAQLPSRRGGPRGSTRLDPELRATMERDLGVLQGALADLADPTAPPPEPLVIRPGAPGQPGIDDAVDLFDRRAAEVTEVLRALRRSRRILDEAYDADLHEPALARFDWRSFTADELLLVPPVVVVDDNRADTSTKNSWRQLTALSAVLRSGRPIHVLWADRGTTAPGSQPGEGFDPGLGYLAMAHREVFVLQSSLASPDHLTAGLERLATSAWPCLAVVGMPAGGTDPWLSLRARTLGRDLPVYCYDPARGDTWAERFDLAGNPSCEAAWATVGDEPFTFADAALLDAAWTGHVTREQTAVEAGDADLLPLADFLVADPDVRAHVTPFVHAAGEDGAGPRLLLDHELAFACDDRRRAWRLLQELAGTDNEHARRAAAAARHAAEAEALAERQQLEAAHAEELEAVRRQAASEAMDRVVAVLMDVAVDGDTAPVLPGISTAPRPAPATTPDPAPKGNEDMVAEPPAAERVVAAEAVEAADAAADSTGEAASEEAEEPWVDSILCTSCDDCIRVNSQLFRYNADKQVEIADPTAGTYEQLVRAAEQCPARCIHPGTPRPDDASATPELIERARPLR